MQSDAITEATGTAVTGVKWVDRLQQLKGQDNIRTREDPMIAIVAKRQAEEHEAEQRRERLRKLQEDDAAGEVNALEMFRKQRPVSSNHHMRRFEASWGRG
jgi:hypothetical protein